MFPKTRSSEMRKRKMSNWLNVFPLENVVFVITCESSVKTAYVSCLPQYCLLAGKDLSNKSQEIRLLPTGPESFTYLSSTVSCPVL
jgi:hypothetical protein